MEIRQFFYIYFHIKDGSGVEFTACEGEMLTDGALTSFTLY